MTYLSKHQNEKNHEMVFLYIGILLAIIGSLGILLADIPGAFNCITVTGGIIGLFNLGFCLLNPRRLKTYDLLGAILLFGYATGALNSLIRYAIEGNSLILHSSASEYWLSRTLSLVIAATGFLHLIGRIDSNGYIFPKIDITNLEQKKFFWGLGGATLVILFLIITGKLGFMGSILTEKGSVEISTIGSLALDLITPAGATSVFLSVKSKNKNYKIYFLTVAIILLTIQFGLGRRIFVFTALTYVMAALLAEKPKKLFTFKYFFAAACLLLMVQIATTAFYTLRIANHAFKYDATPPSIVRLIPEAVDVYRNREKLFLDEKMKENISSRTFILEYLADLTSRTEVIDPMYGTNLLRAMIVTTPSFIYPGKYRNPLFATEEEIANPHFHMPVWDAANSILTASVIDLGQVGFFVLPGLFALIFSLALRTLKALLPPIAGVVLSFFVAKVMLSVETDITGYFSSLRTLFIFGIALFFYIRQKRLRLLIDKNLPSKGTVKINLPFKDQEKNL